MSKKEGIRQRKNKDKKGQPQAVEKTTSAGNSTTTTLQVGLQDNDETLKETFLRHPLVRVAPFVLLPYVIYHLIYFLRLKHPEWISYGTLGLVHLRPATEQGAPRQVLILGPEFPENRFVAGGMASTLKLEIVHEAFDTHHYFCRDGSVSWFQLMRFVEPVMLQSTGRDAAFAAWKQLCVDRNHSVIELFHPKEYDSSSCRSYEDWSKCWTQECVNLVKDLWGCEKDDTRECPLQFSRILHQVRHPLRTIEALNASICPYPKVKNSFLTVVKGFFPTRDWTSLSCLNSMAWYTIDFHMLLLKAREEGLIHGIFQIENTSPCEVATLAGFRDPQVSLYAPNVELTAHLCRNDDVDTGNLDAISLDLFARVKTTNKGDKIAGLTPVSLQDLADDKQLMREVTHLMNVLGYGKEGGDEFI